MTKNRFTGDLGMFTLEFDRDCLSFAQRSKKSSKSSSGPEAGTEDVDLTKKKIIKSSPTLQEVMAREGI